jgi:hypothetical protein
VQRRRGVVLGERGPRAASSEAAWIEAVSCFWRGPSFSCSRRITVARVVTRIWLSLGSVLRISSIDSWSMTSGSSAKEMKKPSQDFKTRARRANMSDPPLRDG